MGTAESNRARTSGNLNLIALTRIENTRIFSRVQDRSRLYISKSYRGVRCPICRTMQHCAQLVHAKLTHKILDKNTYTYLYLQVYLSNG